MKVNSIEWHQKNLENQKLFCERELETLGTLKLRIYRLQNDINFSSFQIEEAIKEKKETFDADRFKIKNRS